MYGSEDSFGPTLVGELVNAGVQYFMGTWYKRSPGSMAATITEAGVAVIGTGLKGKTTHPYLSASLEASGSGAVGALGLAIAANSKTMGGRVAGPIPMNRGAATGYVGRPGGVVNNPGPPPVSYGWTPVNEMGIAG